MDVLHSADCSKLLDSSCVRALSNSFNNKKVERTFSGVSIRDFVWDGLGGGVGDLNLKEKAVCNVIW